MSATQNSPILMETPMSKNPTPDKEGHFWAKLVHPSDMPEGEDWASPDWEVVQVNDNNGTGSDQWRVFVPGIEPGQMLDAFIWGPEVPQFNPPATLGGPHDI
tara:strand:+ start:43288 stop:43593 length:306 start_codon:yes stop_codon:yes gene_type:complete